jgi:hypothetical protein
VNFSFRLKHVLVPYQLNIWGVDKVSGVYCRLTFRVRDGYLHNLVTERAKVDGSNGAEPLVHDCGYWRIGWGGDTNERGLKMDKTGALLRAVAFLALILVVGAYTTLGQDLPKDPTPLAYIGTIMDSQCGKTGSHAEMMKKEGAKDSKSCTEYCVKLGEKYVLFDPTANTLFNLDDQDKASKFSGQKVKVVGSYDPATKTIHVQTIESPTVTGAP